MSRNQKKVCVVGAGAAGLAAARHATNNGFSCTLYEMGPEIGGVWVYTEDIDEDQYGYPVHSAMYKGLMTNLPKEIMGFPDFPIPDQPQSYLTQDEILTFLNAYVDNFDLRSSIKFNHIVTEILPMDDNKWQVTVEEKKSKTPSSEIFDSVMICTGHYSSPHIPDIPGKNTFKGKQFHSKYYRHPGPFEGQNVLLIGAGPSGMDLALHLAKQSNKVFFSHNNAKLKAKYPDNVFMKPLASAIREDGVEFEDGTFCEVDVILYCTGYVYDFPFLHESCGIRVDDNYIQPLYKHIIHIEKPTMSFIGIPFNVCAFQMFDLQARFYMNYLNGQMKLPSDEEMKRITRAEMDEKIEKGYVPSQAHMLGPYQRSYYSDLADLAGTYDIPDVLLKIKDCSFARFTEDLLNFRKDTYTVLDDKNFIHVK